MYKSCSFESQSITSICDLLETSSVLLSNLIQGFSDKEYLSYKEQYQFWVVKAAHPSPVQLCVHKGYTSEELVVFSAIYFPEEG